MYKFRTPEGLGFNPLAPLMMNGIHFHKRKSESIYLFALNGMSVFKSLFVSVSAIFLSFFFGIVFWRASSDNAMYYFVAYLSAMIMLFIVRMTLFKVIKVNAADTAIEGTVSFWFAFEWIAIFMPMAVIVCVSGFKFDGSIDLFHLLLFVALLIVAYVPTVLLSLARYIVMSQR